MIDFALKPSGWILFINNNKYIDKWFLKKWSQNITLKNSFYDATLLYIFNLNLDIVKSMHVDLNISIGVK